MLIRVLRAVLLLSLLRVLNLTTEVNVRALSVILVMQGQLFLALFQC